jgi:hypothetical protein
MIRILLVLSLFFIGCNPVKRIMKDQNKVAQVVAEYVKQNPQKNDTTIHIGLPQVVRDSIVRDTVQLPYPVKERYETIHYRDNVRTDTVKIIDRTLLQALDTRVRTLEANVKSITDERDYWRKRAILYEIILAVIIGSVLFFFTLKLYTSLTLKKIL